MKLREVTLRDVTLTIDNAELAVLRNALRDYASNHSYGAVMLDSMKVLFEIDKPVIDEQRKLIEFGKKRKEGE
jgi:hypothetical protein